MKSVTVTHIGNGKYTVVFAGADGGYGVVFHSLEDAIDHLRGIFLARDADAI